MSDLVFVVALFSLPFLLKFVLLCVSLYEKAKAQRRQELEELWSDLEKFNKERRIDDSDNK